MEDHIFELNIDVKNGPLVAAAIHDGHHVRNALQGRFKLTDKERLREEDPYTGDIARQFDNYIIGTRSRFEVDLNRAPDKAVYRKPEDAWGLHVWKDGITDAEVEESMRLYHHFYEQVEKKLAAIINVHGFVIVYDIHSYNHRREGPDKPASSEHENPQVNIGTHGMKLEIWRPVLDRFKQVLQAYDYPGGSLDVRENVKFEGGYFMSWIHKNFREKAFAPAIEFKKIFMDEWTDELIQDKLEHLKKAMQQSVPQLLEEIKVNEKIPATL